MEDIRDYLRGYPSILVAFSGGVDSSLLMDLAVESLGRDRVLGVFMNMAFQTQEDKRIVLEEAERRQWPLEILELDFQDLPDRVVANPENRCYWCKKMIFEKFLDLARERGLAVVCDGSNLDDLGDYRPGRQALEELGVVSPFLACHWTKDQIRQEAKARGLSTWNRPSDACLASRIYPNHAIEAGDLKRVEAGEAYLKSLGFNHVRLRTLGRGTSIEVEASQVARAQDLLAPIREELKKYGYDQVDIDPRGYRQGSLNKEKK